MNALKRPLFLLDLAEELTWLKDHAGADVAERWFEALMATIEFLEKRPRIGRQRNDLAPSGIRSWRVNKFPRWLIFYEVTDQERIVLYRLRSGTMNLVVMNMES